MGNQMFQWAFAKSLSLKYNMDLKVDLSFLKNRNMGHNFVYRDYDLDIFNIDSDFDIPQIRVGIVNEPNYNYSESMISSIDNVLKSDNSINLLIDGYWQTPKYFNDVENIIRDNFTFRNKVEDSEDDKVKNMLNNINRENSVMLNVRRTDYLNTNIHGVMGMEYIESGIKLIESKIENPHYYLFSDDVEWCVENIKIDNMTIVDHTYKGDRFSYYLQLMKNCKHFIIPNSSFAWWAAWLNDKDTKIVITPKNWFTDESINTNDLIPSDWIRI